MFLRIIVHTFQYSYIVYLSRIISYYFQNKRIDLSDNYHVDTRIVSVHHSSLM